jgi:hypothetical protein
MKQQPTRRRVDANIDSSAKNIAESIMVLQHEHELTFEQSAKCYELALIEARLTAYIDNGDFLDENLYGIGDALENITINAGIIARNK